MKPLLVAGLAAAATASLSTVALLRQRSAVTRVPPGLRAVPLWMPLSVRGPVSLRVLRRLLDTESPLHPDVEVDERVVDGVRVLVYEPAGRTRPTGALLWIHGGGLVAGVPEAEHAWCSGIAADLGIPVVNVDYRLAPEHPFPAGLDDCQAALAWIVASADELGIDPGRIVVGGASAGGGLAAAVCQQVHDLGSVRVALQLLVYPMLDDRTVTRADAAGERTLVWTRGSNRFGWASHLGHAPGEEETRPYAVPARRDDLSGLPPAWIGVGDIDLFCEEDVTYARRLQEDGVEVDLQVVPGLFHGADVLWGDRHETTRAFREAMTGAVRSAVADDVRRGGRRGRGWGRRRRPSGASA